MSLILNTRRAGDAWHQSLISPEVSTDMSEIATASIYSANHLMSIDTDIIGIFR